MNRSLIDHPVSRRAVLLGASAAALTSVLPLRAKAAQELVVGMYPGAWEDAYTAIVVPALQKQDIDLSFASLLADDEVAKASASRGKPPFDALVLDPGPRIVAIDAGILEPFDATKLTNRDFVPPVFVDQWGVGVSAQMIGIGYNPKKVDKPTGWLDLLSPKYYGKVGLTGFQTSSSVLGLLEMNKQLGGSVDDVSPLFKALKEFLPHAGAVGDGVSIPTLFQQGQIDVLFHTYTGISNLQARGVDIEFVNPDSGTPMFYNTLHIAKGAQQPDLAYKYIDTVISAPVQTALQAKPYNFLSVNNNVDLSADFPPSVIKSHDDLAKMITYDWAKINKYLPGWVDEYTKTVAS
ncbi:MAG TPA: extracellular solute-binding protein [Gemmataceae bacterium]|nr:extracellular solute-binding protein [Gemmataceae bacterium]